MIKIINFSDDDCQDFNKQFSKMFSSSNTSFKVHHIIHYAMAIKAFGPLFYYSTLRYERVHQLLKKVVKSSQSYLNLSNQIANRWAILNLIKSNHLNVDLNKDDIFDIYEKGNLNLNPKIPQELLRMIDTNHDLIVLNSSIINDLNLKKNEIYLIGYTSPNSLPIFFIINYLIQQNNEVKILGHIINCTEFYQRVLCFKVRQNSELIELDISKIKFHEPVSIFNTVAGHLININFYIPLKYFEIYSHIFDFDEVENSRFVRLDMNQFLNYENEDDE